MGILPTGTYDQQIVDFSFGNKKFLKWTCNKEKKKTVDMVGHDKWIPLRWELQERDHLCDENI